jgi:beta-lactamase regulating signal transducer with metallopeptidase domain
MSLIDSLSGPIAWFSVVACVVLGVTTLVANRLVQPLERIRVIQCSLATLLAATVVGLGGWGPSLRVPGLPVSSTGSGPREATAPEAGQPRLAGEDVDGPGERRGRPTTEVSPVVQPTDDGGSQPAAARDWELWRARVAVILYLLISGSLFGYYVLGQLLARRLVRVATPLRGLVAVRATQILARLAPGANVRVASSPRVSAPMVFGLWSPTIVLPAEVVEPSADPLLLTHCLAHEWKHVEGWDLLTWNLVSVCQVALWPQPFYWALRRELRVSQDHLADDCAARATGEPLAYAEALVDLSRRAGTNILGGLTMADRRSNVFRRVERLLNSSLPILSECRRPLVIAFVALMACVSLVLTSLRGAPAEAAQAPAAANATQTSPPAAGSVEHSGHVYDAETKAPIAGATVIVTRMNSKDWSELAISESKTDADGRYTFTIPPEQLKERFLYLLFDLRHDSYAPVHCGSYAYSMIQRNLTVGDPPWFTKLHMAPGVTLGGRLVDENGRPVAGVPVRAESGGTDLDKAILGSFMSAVSDLDGRFRISVTKKGQASVKIMPLEQCMELVSLREKRDDLGDIRLVAGRSLRGKVVDSAGLPVPNVWVNLSEGAAGSYEMQRSSKTNERGEFQTRPIRLGNCYVEVETKATGVPEKETYANFHDEPTPAVFIPKVIDVTEDSVAKGVTIQADPHVMLAGRYVNSKGEPCSFHVPRVFGRMDESFLSSFSTEATKDAKTGEFKLMVPRGMRDARVEFTTNEHTALKVQLPGKEMSTWRFYTFPVMNEDIVGIKVIRYVAPLLLVSVVDEAGQPVADADIRVNYRVEMKDPSPGIRSTSFEKQGGGVYRSSSLCPDAEFVVTATKGDLKSEPRTMTLGEGVTERVTLKLGKQ